MESLIFLIVLAIIIISNIMNVRKKTTSRPSGEKAGQGGLKKSLKDAFAELRAEMEGRSDQGARQDRPHAGRSVWDELMGRESRPEPEAEESYAEESRSPKLETGPKTRMDTKEPPLMETRGTPRLERQRDSLLEERQKRGETPETRMAKAETRSRRQEMEESAERLGHYPQDIPAPPPDRRRRSKAVYPVAELRKAIVWSEILDAPVALRSPGHRR